MDRQGQFQDTHPLLQGHKVLEDVTFHPRSQEHRCPNSLKERKWAKRPFQSGSPQQKYVKYRIIRDQAMEPGAWEIL